jgi:hypothetical protein
MSGSDGTVAIATSVPVEAGRDAAIGRRACVAGNHPESKDERFASVAMVDAASVLRCASQRRNGLHFRSVRKSKSQPRSADSTWSRYSNS